MRFRAQPEARPWQTGFPGKKIVAWFKSENAGQEGRLSGLFEGVLRFWA